MPKLQATVSASQVRRRANCQASEEQSLRQCLHVQLQVVEKKPHFIRNRGRGGPPPGRGMFRGGRVDGRGYGRDGPGGRDGGRGRYLERGASLNRCVALQS